MKARAHVFISGRVQGVFFRANTREKAIQLGITGWVRNMWDGRVEAVFEGEKEALERMLGWCKDGPPYASVDDLQVQWDEYQGEFETFEVRYR
ncbi:MAG: acylphosphatase [Candidatus Hydrothermarchaeales archaeon]